MFTFRRGLAHGFKAQQDQGTQHQEGNQGVDLTQVTLTCSPFGRVGSLFQDNVASDPYGDAQAVSSRITDINVNDVVEVGVSAYQDEATRGQL